MGVLSSGNAILGICQASYEKDGNAGGMGYAVTAETRTVKAFWRNLKGDPI